MIQILRFLKPLFTVGNFVKHLFVAFFFGMMIIFAVALLIFNIRTTKKEERNSKDIWLNTYCIAVLIISIIALYVTYG